jgi:very-long-chain enoyl-CoA reductase
LVFCLILCFYFRFNLNYAEPKGNIFLRGALVFIFFCCEIKKLRCHLVQKEVKENLKGEKCILRGAGVDHVSCANFFWEFMSLCFLVCLSITGGFLFLYTLWIFIMRNWALKKHRGYQKRFLEYEEEGLYSVLI